MFLGSVAKNKVSGMPIVENLHFVPQLISVPKVVFNIGGNKYRLDVKINYAYQVVYIRFIGTHKDYAQVDAGEV